MVGSTLQRWVTICTGLHTGVPYSAQFRTKCEPESTDVKLTVLNSPQLSSTLHSYPPLSTVVFHSPQWSPTLRCCSPLSIVVPHTPQLCSTLHVEPTLHSCAPLSTVVPHSTQLCPTLHSCAPLSKVVPLSTVVPHSPQLCPTLHSCATFSIHIFGPQLYGGSALSSAGAGLLQAQCVLLVFLALNGVTEAYTFAVMSDTQLRQ